MRKRTRLLISLFLLPILLSGCLVVPWDDGYYGGGHRGHRHYDRW